MSSLDGSMIHKKKKVYNSSHAEERFCFEIHSFESRGNKKFLTYTSFIVLFPLVILHESVRIICIILHQ